MKKLIKPVMTIEDHPEEVVQALCENDGCGSNCKCDNVGDCVACESVRKVDIDDDILF